MENVKLYCDALLGLIKEIGEEYIYDPRWRIIDGKDLFASIDDNGNDEIESSDDLNGGSNEACVNLALTLRVGEYCDGLRRKDVDAIRDKLLTINSDQSRMVYAKNILQCLYEIQLNHPIFHYRVFKEIVILAFFSDVTEAFGEYGINLQNILADCQKKHGTFFCYWLKFPKPHCDTIGVPRCVYSESDIPDSLPNTSQSEPSDISDETNDDLSNIENASQCEPSDGSDETNDDLSDIENASRCEPLDGSDETNDDLSDIENASRCEPSDVSDGTNDNLSNIEDEFYKLFDGYDKDIVLELIKRLEEFDIVREQRYVHKTKNHLVKLIIFMKDKGILRYSKMITVARVFYGYFNVVVSKASIGKNSVTERNLREIENKGIKGLSKEEISNFKLICAHFLK